MDEKTFNDGLKLFKRFLKEEGLYLPVFKFLFKDGRKTIHLFYEFNSKRFDDVDDWAQLLFKTNLMVGKGEGTYDRTNFFHKLDSYNYGNLVTNRNLALKWKEYYNEHKK